MSIDELRAGFSRLATQTRPAPQPYARLIARRRKRFRLRLAGIAAALLAAVVSAPLALQAGSAPPGPPPMPMPFTAWTKRLIDSPTRGSLAGNTALIEELERAFIAKRGADRVPEALDRTKVLFAHDIGAVRHVLVAHYSDTRAYLVLRYADAAAGIAQLMNAGAAFYPSPGPFFVTITSFEGGLTVLGVAPGGCLISTSDGPAAMRDYVARDDAPEGEVWRVSCEGKEMEARSLNPHGGLMLLPDRLSAYKWFTGRVGAVRWDRNGTTVIAPQTGAGPAILVLGEGEDGVLALDPPDGAPRPSRAVGGSSRTLVGTGNAYATGDIVVVRVPQRAGNGAELSNQLLVLGPAGSRAEAISNAGLSLATVELTDGIGYLVVDIGAATRIKVGSVSFDFNEPAEGVRLFEQPLFNRWE